MDIVRYAEGAAIGTAVHKLFSEQKALLESILPGADIQHVGSTAVPNSLTKGDLDIQIRVQPEMFEQAILALSELYESNEGSVQTAEFRAFKDDSAVPPLGIQLTVVNSEFDFFWKFRDVLRGNDNYRRKYDALKKRFEGQDMESYREAKNVFFEWLMQTPEFEKL
ncbi:GrpB family protein [Cohnella lubricantis]|uniref:GrpB family protein n=1 Tax=Cohnella lubricantis TaxID=2163172 RepID=A0A841TAX9_9BACL|nr:GrpB family protein [Cohnella lubricantis]MBB6678152.1 GrpB family protein [Cohnella lubricantis]MBP2120634.1 GrpB-like predicted nucleotidyltransferase (UPF0157 family) [Cohnella lubricantis]